MRKALLLFFFLSSIVFIQCDICRFNDPIPFFDIKDMKVTLLSDKGFSQFDTIKEGQRIVFNKLNKLVIDFKVDFVASLFQKKSIDFNSLYACSPTEPGFMGSKLEKYAKIEIITLYPYDISKPAGSIINEYFIVRNYSLDGQSIEEIVLNKNNIKESFLNLDLSIRPQIPGPMKFEILIELSTNEIYKVLSPEFIVY